MCNRFDMKNMTDTKNSKLWKTRNAMKIWIHIMKIENLLYLIFFFVLCVLIQEALNIWRGKLFHFFQISYDHIYPKVIVISIVDLQKTNNFAKFGGYCSKNAPATPLRSLKWSRAWQAYFFRNHLQIWQKVEISWVQKLVKIWCWYLKPLLSNSKSTNIYHLP